MQQKDQKGSRFLLFTQNSHLALDLEGLVFHFLPTPGIQSPSWPQPAVWASGPRSPMRMKHICWFFTADSLQVAVLAESQWLQATLLSAVPGDEPMTHLVSRHWPWVLSSKLWPGGLGRFIYCSPASNPRNPCAILGRVKGHGRSCWGDQNVLNWFMVKVTQLGKFTKNHRIVQLKQVNSII